MKGKKLSGRETTQAFYDLVPYGEAEAKVAMYYWDPLVEVTSYDRKVRITFRLLGG